MEFETGTLKSGENAKIEKSHSVLTKKNQIFKKISQNYKKSAVANLFLLSFNLIELYRVFFSLILGRNSSKTVENLEKSRNTYFFQRGNLFRGIEFFNIIRGGPSHRGSTLKSQMGLPVLRFIFF